MTKPVAPEEPDVAEVAAIARGLSGVQKRAVLALSDRWRLVKSTGRTPVFAMHLVAPTFVEMRRSDSWQCRHQFRLTGAGLVVRAYLLSPEPSCRIP